MSEKQAKFAVMVAQLILWASENGYRVTLGDAYRDPRVFGMFGTFRGYGRRTSLHKRRLAIDLNLFKQDDAGQWRYCDRGDDHTPLGEKWESMGGSWGGRFNDGNHYSLEHDGYR
tara:strand:+ start:2312 stop:2656 length:345 start_codon:yes stop_codon:yes gene_type:complete